MDEQMMRPINNADENEQANVVFIPDEISRQLMTYPITYDEVSEDFIDNSREPIIIDTGSKLDVVFKQYLAFTHDHPCNQPIPLQ